MKVMITGGCGFIGAHVVEHILHNTDWEIVVLDKLTYASNGLNRLRDIKYFDRNRIDIMQHDFATLFPEGVTQEIGQLDYILHLGAETHVDRSLDNAIPFALTNMLGTTNLLEWVRHTQKNLKRYVQFSTDEVYGSAPVGIYFQEWDTMKPSNPYAGSKAGADMMAYSFYHAHKLPIIITRTMNCIGERQHPEKFVPKTIRSVFSGCKVVLHGINKVNISSRCWIHARNTADALMYLLENSEAGDMYHIVGEERSVFDVADIICQEVNGRGLHNEEIEWIDFHTARAGHDKRYAMSGEKLRMMGWQPKIDFEESLRKTVQWSLDNPQWL